jgi:hypothetical protein
MPPDNFPDTLPAPLPAKKIGHPLPWWITLLRWLSVPYMIGVAFLALGTVMVAGYGLAHASEGAVSQFLLMVAGGAAVLVVPVASLWFNSRALWVRGLQAVAVLVMLVGFFYIGKMLWYVAIEPQVWASRFTHYTQDISVKLRSEKPVLLGDIPIGVETTVDITLPKAVPLNRNGYAVVEMLRRSHITVPGNTGLVFSNSVYLDQTATFAGQPITQLPGVDKMQHANLDFSRAGYNADFGELPKGVYTLTSQHFFNGIAQHRDADTRDAQGRTVAAQPVLCKQNFKADYQKAALLEMAKTQGKTVTVVLSASISLGDRRGYRGTSKTADLAFRYDHAQWMQHYEQLPLPDCEALAVQKKQLEEQARKVEEDKLYKTGGLPYADNPLYKEACAGDVAAIQARYAAEKDSQGRWKTAFNLSGTVQECSIAKRNLAVFSLLMPALIQRYHDDTETEGYCNLLRGLHQSRDVELLTSVDALGGALVCPGRRDWMLGLAPRPLGYNNYDVGIDQELLRLNSLRPDTVPWLTLLKKSGANLCDQTADQPSLLSIAARWYAPQAVELLLNAGCNPSEPLSAAAAGRFGSEDHRFSASVWWAVRRFSSAEGSTAYGPLDNQDARVPKLSRAMPISALELNQSVNDITGQTTLHMMPMSPMLLQQLVKAGARLDLVSNRGDSWLPVNDNYVSLSPEYLAVLQALPIEQLKKLTATVTLAGKSMPLKALQTPDKNGYTNNFRNLMCKRRAIVCTDHAPVR